MATKETASGSVSGAVAQKRLKCSEPDLEISIGGDGDQTCLRMCYSMIMASHSEYIDTMLSVPMKECRTRKLHFPDISVESWDLMMEFLTEPFDRGFEMSLQDALAVAKFYDKYHFRHGSILCDRVVTRYMKSLSEQESNRTLNIDLFVQAVVVAFQANLLDSYKEGLECIMRIFSNSCSQCYCPAVFQECHVRKLVPVLVDLLEKYPSIRILPNDTILTGSNSNSNNNSNNNSNDKTLELINNQMFSYLYTLAWEAHDTQELALKYRISCRIRMWRGPSRMNGFYRRSLLTPNIYEGDPISASGAVLVKYKVGWKKRLDLGHNQPGQHRRQWEIYEETEEAGKTVLWTSQFNSNVPLPPKIGWQPVHPSVENNREPELEYVD